MRSSRKFHLDLALPSTHLSTELFYTVQQFQPVCRSHLFPAINDISGDGIWDSIAPSTLKLVSWSARVGTCVHICQTRKKESLIAKHLLL